MATTTDEVIITYDKWTTTLSNNLAAMLKNTNTKEVDEARAIKILEYLTFVFQLKSDMDFAILMGVAFDSVQATYDRRRFKSSIRYILENSTASETFVLAIDPNFGLMNILMTISKLLTKDFTGKRYSLTFSNIPERNIRDLLYGYFSYGLRDKTMAEKMAIIKPLKEEFNDIKILVTTITDIDTGESHKFNFLFLNYALTSAYASSPFVTNNIPNIQSGTKTLDTYLALDQCKVKEGTFYSALQALALSPKVNSVFFVSNVTTFSQGPFSGEHKKVYKARRVRREFGAYSNWFIINRYIENLCEILSVMRNVSDSGKQVTYITLNRPYPAFQHKNVNVQLSESFEPLGVPFDKNTTFFQNNLFIEESQEEPQEKKGGRTLKRKRRTTRRRRV
jgi:hypothetical protein